METVRIQVEADHIAKLIRTPKTGLTELIWNSIDADARTVRIELERNESDGVEAVIVVDDGTGMPYERAELSFGRLGGSWKATSSQTESGRPLHGRNGQGRISAFALGESVLWESVAVQTAGGALELVQIEGQRARPDEVSIEHTVSADQATGTRVTVRILTDAAIRWLNRPDIREYLTAQFALAIERDDLTIIYDGSKIDPEDLIHARKDYDIEVPGAGEPAKLTVIEWTRAQENRSLLLCTGEGSVLHESLAGIQAPGFHFTAYLKWDGFKDLVDYLALADLGSEPVSGIVQSAKEKLREHFKEAQKLRQSAMVQKWKDEKVYPYVGKASSTVEKSERELFEIVAVTASRTIDSAPLSSKKLSLRLIREALENNPGGLHKVLADVLSLSDDQIGDLADLLSLTSLGSMIATTREITDRLDFLVGLESLIYGESRKDLLERSQLQKILAQETWIFREEYALTADDVSLTTALRQHVGILGRSDLAPSDLSDEVRDLDGRRTVVDMMLSRMIEQSENRRQHVVIELKRPTVAIGMAEVTQIINYANTVATDARFDHSNTHWEFWIVGDRVKPEVAPLANQKGREAGIVSEYEQLNLTIRAVEWSKIIQDARHRLSFVKKALTYGPTEDTARRYLERKHGEYLPGRGVEVEAPDNSGEAA